MGVGVFNNFVEIGRVAYISIGKKSGNIFDWSGKWNENLADDDSNEEMFEMFRSHLQGPSSTGSLPSLTLSIRRAPLSMDQVI